MTDLTVSPLETIRRKNYLSPQTSHRSTTEPTFDKASYSPISSNRVNNSYIKVSQQRAEPTIYFGLHKDLDHSHARNEFHIEPSYSFQSKLPTKSPRERTYINESDLPNSSRYLKAPEIILNNTKKIEERSRTPRDETGSGLYRTIKDRNDAFRQPEDTSRTQRLTINEPSHFNLIKSGVSIQYGDILSPGPRTATSATSTGNSKAYAKAMKALQERVLALESQMKALEKEKVEAEKYRGEGEIRCAELGKKLEEAEKRVRELREVEKENRILEEKVVGYEKEKDTWKRERDEVVKEKEMLMQEKEKSIKEKADWVDGKEVLNRKLFEMEREKEETERRNKILEESLKKLEKEHMEYKKVYHQHLEGVVVKNEALVIEIAQVKEYYDSQIKEFERELGSIEESHSRKVESYEQTIQELSKQNKDYEELFRLKQREVTALRAQLNTVESLAETRKLQELRFLEGRSTPNSKIEVIDLQSADKQEPERSRITYSSYNDSDSKTDIRGQNRSPMQQNQSSITEEEPEVEAVKSVRSRITRETPTNTLEASHGVKRKEATPIRKEDLAYEGEIVAKTEEMRSGRGGRAVPVSSKGESRNDIKEGREGITRNLKDEMNSFGKMEDQGYDRNARSYGETYQGLKYGDLQSGYGDAGTLWSEQVETAQFPKFANFGGEGIGASSRGNSREVKEVTSPPKTFAQVRDHPINTIKVFGGGKGGSETQRLREKIMEKEKELGQANDQYQALLKKIQETTNSLERSKMRSDLIELTDEIQKINDQIYQLKKQETYL